MNYRSHTLEEIREAIARGAQVWALDTGPDGEDDVLIGSREDVFQDICSFHDISELPPHWSLKPFEEHRRRS
jgi:hypothetical protein